MASGINGDDRISSCLPVRTSTLPGRVALSWKYTTGASLDGLYGVPGLGKGHGHKILHIGFQVTWRLEAGGYSTSLSHLFQKFESNGSAMRSLLSRRIRTVVSTLLKQVQRSAVSDLEI